MYGTVGVEHFLRGCCCCIFWLISCVGSHWNSRPGPRQPRPTACAPQSSLRAFQVGGTVAVPTNFHLYCSDNGMVARLGGGRRGNSDQRPCVPGLPLGHDRPRQRWQHGMPHVRAGRVCPGRVAGQLCQLPVSAGHARRRRRPGHAVHGVRRRHVPGRERCHQLSGAAAERARRWAGALAYTNGSANRQTATVCGAGHEPINGSWTPASDRQCQSCVPAVTFKREAGAGLCRPVSVCPAGQFEAQGPTIVSDRACLPCPAGAWCVDSRFSLAPAVR